LSRCVTDSRIWAWIVKWRGAPTATCVRSTRIVKSGIVNCCSCVARAKPLLNPSIPSKRQVRRRVGRFLWIVNAAAFCVKTLPPLHRLRNEKRRFLKPPRGIVFGDKPVNLSPGRYPIDCRFKERQLCPGRVSLSLLSNGFQCEWSPFYHCKDIHCRLLRSRYRDLDPSLHSIVLNHACPVAKIYRKNLFSPFHLHGSRQGGDDWCACPELNREPRP